MSDIPGSAPIKNAPGPLKKIPKWAWVASGGVIVGVAVMRWRSNKGATAPSDSQTATADTGQTYQSFPAGGTVAAPAAAGDAGYGGDGGGSTVDIPSLIEGVGNAIKANTPEDHTADWIELFRESLPGFAGGGGAPQSSTTQDGPAHSDVAPTPPSPAPTPNAPTPSPAPPKAPAYKIEYENRTEDNGKSGAARRVWCSKVTIHRYPDGHGVVVARDKIRDGKC